MAAADFLVVGLGNPGAAYRDTPHNAGYAVVARLASAGGVTLRRSWRFNARLGRVRLAGADLWLMQPETFMNRSGDAVAPWMGYYRLAAGRLLVVMDDIDRPLGTLRLRGQGGHGGHNGLRSVIERLGAETFPRLRIGIGRGRSGGDVVRHVLTPFSRQENAVFQRVLERATEAVGCLLADGLDAAMNRYNGDVAGAGSGDPDADGNETGS